MLACADVHDELSAWPTSVSLTTTADGVSAGNHDAIGDSVQCSFLSEYHFCFNLMYSTESKCNSFMLWVVDYAETSELKDTFCYLLPVLVVIK